MNDAERIILHNQLVMLSCLQDIQYKVSPRGVSWIGDTPRDRIEATIAFFDAEDARVKDARKRKAKE